MPADFPAAALRLRQLHAELCQGSTRPDGELSALDEARDVARWLAQLAGDSDLNETDWNRVNEAAATLQDLLGPPGAPLPRAYPELADPIEEQVIRVGQLAMR